MCCFLMQEIFSQILRCCLISHVMWDLKVFQGRNCRLYYMVILILWIMTAGFFAIDGYSLPLICLGVLSVMECWCVIRRFMPDLILRRLFHTIAAIDSLLMLTGVSEL